MIRIIGAQQAPQLVATLREWYINEWGKVDSFEGNHPGYDIPEPLLAVDEDDQLKGGLAFSTFNLPEASDTNVWINAVYVSPECRGQQIASKLITGAEHSAASMQIETLFVFTQMPGLYQKLGWQLLDQTDADCVLNKRLAGGPSA